MKITNRSLSFVVMLIAVGITGVATGPVAHASYDSVFPNISTGISDTTVSSTGRTPTYKLAVGKDKDFVQKSAVNMRIYSREPVTSTNIDIWGQNLCGGGSGDTIYGAPPSNINYLDYRVYGAGGKVVLQRHAVFGGGGNACDESKPMSIVIPKSAFKKDDDTQLAYVKFTATVSSAAENWVNQPGKNRGFVNRFSISSPGTAATSKITIAPEGRGALGGSYDDGSSVMLEQAQDLPEWTRYSVKFGSDCTVTGAGKRAEISFYDLDNALGDPKSAQYKYPMSLQLFSYPRNSSTRSDVPLNGTSSNVVLPPEVNNQPYKISFTAKPELRYELFMYRVYQNNAVQFTLPFDGIHWNVPCDRGGGDPDPVTTTVRPEINLTSTSSWNDTIGSNTVEEGDPIFVQTRFKNEGAQNAQVRYTRQVWWERGNDTTFNAVTDKLINTGSDADSAYSLSPNQLRSLATHEEEASFDDGNKRLCMRLITSSANSQTIVRPAERNLYQCALIGKTPTFQAWGSDVRVGGNGGSNRYGIGAITKKGSGSSQWFGSWGEYGVFASRGIGTFGSAATPKLGPATGASIDPLTFANAGGPAGYFAQSSGIGPLKRGEIIEDAAFKKNLVGTLPRGSISNTRIYRPTKVDGSPADVVIRNDIRYNDANARSAGTIPQVIIIANNIDIQASVGRIDAWLIADGTIDTCSDVGDTALNANTCKRKLTINGPVMANLLKLKRTYTNKDEKGEPAEVVNLRSDAYIWARHQYGASGNASMRTSFMSELPPRY